MKKIYTVIAPAVEKGCRMSKRVMSSAPRGAVASACGAGGGTCTRLRRTARLLASDGLVGLASSARAPPSAASGAAPRAASSASSLRPGIFNISNYSNQDKRTKTILFAHAPARLHRSYYASRALPVPAQLLPRKAMRAVESESAVTTKF